MFITKVFSPGILNELLNKTVLFHNAILAQKDINEKIIELILTTTKNDERQKIRDNYKKVFHYPIQNDISKIKEKNPLLHDISLNMFDTPLEYDARELHKALINNIDIDTIIEIFCSRPKKSLELIDLAYKNFYEISLKEEIQKKLPKKFSEYILVLMDTERPLEQTLVKNEPFKIAEEIIRNGIKSYINDINMFKNTFVEKSRKDLILISRSYFELSKKCLYDDIIEENNGQNSKDNDNNAGNIVLNLIKNMLFAVITPAEFFSCRSKEALNGPKKNINNLIRILITRREIDIKMIRDYYFTRNKSDIKNDIKNDVDLKDNKNVSNILINLFK